MAHAIVGYRLKSHIDRMLIDFILKNPMPIWNDKDKSVYFIRGHVAGSLVAKMKELQVLDLWFTPIYEDEEIKSDWVKENHLEHYYKEGIMSDTPKQGTLEEVAYQRAVDRNWNPNSLETRRVGNEIIEAVKFGAKWQAERMYSEEDMRLAINKARDISNGEDCFNAEDISGCTEVCTYGWKFNISEDLIIEQFKKK